MVISILSARSVPGHCGAFAMLLFPVHPLSSGHTLYYGHSHFTEEDSGQREVSTLSKVTQLVVNRNPNLLSAYLQPHLSLTT